MKSKSINHRGHREELRQVMNFPNSSLCPLWLHLFWSPPDPVATARGSDTQLQIRNARLALAQRRRLRREILARINELITFKVVLLIVELPVAAASRQQFFVR